MTTGGLRPWWRPRSTGTPPRERHLPQSERTLYGLECALCYNIGSHVRPPQPHPLGAPSAPPLNHQIEAPMLPPVQSAHAPGGHSRLLPRPPPMPDKSPVRPPSPRLKDSWRDHRPRPTSCRSTGAASRSMPPIPPRSARHTTCTRMSPTGGASSPCRTVSLRSRTLAPGCYRMRLRDLLPSKIRRGSWS